MRPFLISLLCSLCSVAAWAAATPAKLAAGNLPGLTVRYAGGFLTVDANEVEAGRLLQEVARQSGITVEFANHVPRPVTLSLAPQPLEAGLKTILRALHRLEGASHIMLYDRLGRVTRLHVYLPRASATTSHADSLNGSITSNTARDEEQAGVEHAPAILPVKQTALVRGDEAVTSREPEYLPPGSDELPPMEQVIAVLEAHAPSLSEPQPADDNVANMTQRH